VFLWRYSDRPEVSRNCILANDGLVCASRYSSVWSDISPASIQASIWLKTSRSAEASFFQSGSDAASSNQLLMALPFNESAKQWNLLMQLRHVPRAALKVSVTGNRFEIPSWVGVLHVTWPGSHDTYPLSYSSTIDSIRGKPLTARDMGESKVCCLRPACLNSNAIECNSLTRDTSFQQFATTRSMCCMKAMTYILGQGFIWYGAIDDSSVGGLLLRAEITRINQSTGVGSMQ